MARLWKTFMLVVALAVVACEAHRRLRYEDIVNRAIEAYNRGQRGRPLFRLLSATPPPGQEERNCTGEFSRRQWSTSLTLTCDRDCRREVSQVATFSDNKSDDSEKDKLEGLPPHAKNIYENAKYDIISNILHNF
nr:neutrophilic granule protein isoform X2 [Rattus norvegicus]